MERRAAKAEMIKIICKLTKHEITKTRLLPIDEATYLLLEQLKNLYEINDSKDYSDELDLMTLEEFSLVFFNAIDFARIMGISEADKLIGVGITDDDIKNNPPQTEDQASADLEVKLKEYEGYVKNRATYTFLDGKQIKDELDLTQTQVDALISLTYNSPNRGLAVIKAIRARKSMDEMKEIWMAGDSARRNKAEWTLFSEGVYIDDPDK